MLVPTSTLLPTKRESYWMPYETGPSKTDVLASNDKKAVNHDNSTNTCFMLRTYVRMKNRNQYTAAIADEFSK
jgi:hypothetical protein